MKKIAVHTAAGPDAAMTEERAGLDVPDVEFRLAGKCRTPEAVAEACPGRHATSLRWGWVGGG